MNRAHRLLGIVGQILLAAALGLTPRLAQAEPKQPLNVETLYNMARLSQLTVAKDAPYAAFVVKQFDVKKNDSSTNIWLLSLTDAKTSQLTRSGKDRTPRFMSGGKLVFLSSRSGKSQLWRIDIRGGEAEQLTFLPVDVDNFILAEDGRTAVVQAAVFPQCATLECSQALIKQKEESKVNARLYQQLPVRLWDSWLDEKKGHLFWVPLSGQTPRDLTPGNFRTPPFDVSGGLDLAISPDGKEVAFAANVTPNPAWNTNNDIFIVPALRGKPKNLTQDNTAADASPAYSPNGRYLAYLAMKRPGFEADQWVLTVLDRKTGKKMALTAKLDRSVDQFTWSSDSLEIAFSAWDRGHEALFRVQVPSGAIIPVLSKHTNTEAQYAIGSKQLVFLQESLAGPAEVYSSSVTGSEVKKLTHFNDALLSTVDLGSYEEIRYPGAGGDEIHGFLVKPPQFNPQKRYPLVLIIHGGPQGLEADSFHWRWNLPMFAAPGFVVAAINFHGSLGYGQAFTDAVSKDWGGKPYEDILKGIDFVTRTYKFVDGQNVSAAGASYGGFMINWILGHTNRFRCLISHAGVYDQRSMYGATEELWFPEWEMGGPPYTHPELYEKFSPSAYAKNFKTPTLVIHGERDYRVPYTQGLQLFTALQRQGIESKLLLFPDENHFVQKPQNARLWWNTMLGWLADHAKINWKPPAEPQSPTAPKTQKIAR